MKKIFTLAVLLATATVTQAQEDLSKQLEVTRAYTPRVGLAEKLPIAPDMTDTVRLRPEISYHITSTASATSFETKPYQPANIGMAPLGTSAPLYIRAGAGAPFRTVFDLYLAPRMRADRSFGLFANHSGSYSKITNDLGVKADAGEMTNGVGLWGSRRWKRYSLEGDITYDNRRYNPYGAADINLDPASSVLQIHNFVYDKHTDRISLGLARGGVRFGDDFTDLSRFNFRVEADGGYAHGSEQADFDFNFSASKMFGEGKHGFEAVLGEQMVIRPASDGVWMPGAVTVSFAPRYLLKTGIWSLRAGIDARYVFNTNSLAGVEQDYLGLAPVFELRVDLAGGAFVPFLIYTSQVVDGDLEAISRRNPYVVTSGPTAWVDNACLGFSGGMGGVFSYRIAGGVSMFDDHQLLIGDQAMIPTTAPDSDLTVDYRPMRFKPVGVDGTRYTVGAELALHNLGGFGARLYGNLNRFDFPEVADAAFVPVGDLPKYDAGLELSYRYKDVFSVRLGAELIGERDYIVRGSLPLSDALVYIAPRFTTRSIDPVMDVSASVEVKVAHGFWAFLEGENLANQALYPYPHYRGFGTGVVGGIKILF